MYEILYWFVERCLILVHWSLKCKSGYRVNGKEKFRNGNSLKRKVIKSWGILCILYKVSNWYINFRDLNTLL
jgi:hypothetical protein